MARYEQKLHLSFTTDTDEDAGEAARRFEDIADHAVRHASANGVNGEVIPAENAYVVADDSPPELVDEEC